MANDPIMSNGVSGEAGTPGGAKDDAPLMIDGVPVVMAKETREQIQKTAAAMNITVEELLRQTLFPQSSPADTKINAHMDAMGERMDEAIDLLMSERGDGRPGGAHPHFNHKISYKSVTDAQFFGSRWMNDAAVLVDSLQGYGLSTLMRLEGFLEYKLNYYKNLLRLVRKEIELRQQGRDEAILLREMARKEQSLDFKFRAMEWSKKSTEEARAAHADHMRMAKMHEDPFGPGGIFHTPQTPPPDETNPPAPPA